MTETLTDQVSCRLEAVWLSVHSQKNQQSILNNNREKSRFPRTDG